MAPSPPPLSPILIGERKEEEREGGRLSRLLTLSPPSSTVPRFFFPAALLLGDPFVTLSFSRLRAVAHIQFAGGLLEKGGREGRKKSDVSVARWGGGGDLL